MPANHGCDQMDGTKEIAGVLIIARGNGPVLLEASKEVLDQMSGLV